MSVRSFAARAAAPTLASLGAGVCLTLALAAAPAGAQQPTLAAAPAPTSAALPTAGYRAELIADIDEVEKKLLGLMDAMHGKYDWRPAAGVRSVGEVFGHVAGDNFVIPAMIGVPAPADMQAPDLRGMFGKAAAMEKITDEATLRANLVRSFAHARQAIATIGDDQMEQKVKMFGQDRTKRAVLILYVTHMHEHLGQSIAYARSNGVTPPWSQGG